MFQNNMIIICNNKKQILKQVNKIINIKLFNMDEFIKSYYFDYDEKSILYIIKKYNVKYEIALEYLNNLIYIEDKEYSNKKLNFLKNLKEELINNNLLIFNKSFKNYIKNKKIVIYNYNLNKFEKYLLKEIDYEVIDTKTNNYEPVIYEFDSVEEEISFIGHSISKLINNGVDINNIKLTNVSKEYINTIEKIFNFYNLKTNKKNNISLYSNIIGKCFYDNINLGIKEAINKIDKYKDTLTYNKIIDICNKYVWCNDINDLKILLDYELKHTYIKNNKYTNEIEVVDLNNYDFKDEYVFLIGFNQSIIPHIYKDEDYINDSIKLDYMDNTDDKNKKEINDILKSIKNIKNLTITYKLKDSFNLYYPSTLIDSLNKEVIKYKNNYDESYSELLDKINLTNMLDNYIKYNEKDNNLNILNSNYNINYNTYLNSFTGLSKDKIQEFIKSKNKFNLSYSSMDNYNRCSFRYYVEKILGVKDELDKFSVTLGNIYHHVLEKAAKQDINIEEEINNYIKDNNIELTNSNKFFLNKTVNNIKYLLEVLTNQMKYCSLNKIDTEKYIEVNLKDNINFIGFIDKIIYDTINDKYIGTIIDYKTYVKKPDLRYIDDGIGMQLPSYMFLAKHAYKDISFAGFYLQNITLDNKSLKDKEDSLKLIGYTNKDEKIIKYFDSSYKDSNVIKSLKVKNDGTFSSDSLKNMLSDKEIDKLIDITKDQIDKTINNILNSNFDINPKFDKKNIGCDFCKYKDICYMKEYNYEFIDANDKFGGDEDVMD